MHVAHSKVTGRKSGARHKHMLSKERKELEVLVQEMDPHLASICPDADYLLSLPGWVFSHSWGRAQQYEMMRNGIGWEDRTFYPKEFVDYIDDLGCLQITAFSDGGVEKPKGLHWHIDDYWVYSWNIEGQTTWHWFDMLEGTIKQEKIGEMDKVMLMPPQTPHTVSVESEYRTSISIVRPQHWDGIKNGSERNQVPKDYKGEY